MTTRRIAGGAGAILLLAVTFAFGAGAGRSAATAEFAARPTPAARIITRTVTKTVKVPVTHTIIKTVKVPVVHTVTKIVTKTVTVVAQPTAEPTASGPQTLVDVQGSDNKQTDTFTTSGPFSIAWNAQANADAGSAGAILFSAELDNVSGDELELVSNSSAATQDSSVLHDDCSGGCYLKITSLGADWHIVVSQ